jgi:hypothetical protein
MMNEIMCAFLLSLLISLCGLSVLFVLFCCRYWFYFVEINHSLFYYILMKEGIWKMQNEPICIDYRCS